MASTEDIEARLCAYVDGELDAVERADIERHLAGNPQHRTLILELMGQRDMLHALPRVRAPRDVAETIGAHLERAALLGDDTDEEAHVVRISHWAQYRAIAAVLFLVFGLAGVVYYVLPSSDPAQSEFARLSTSPPDIVAEHTDAVADRGGMETDSTVLTGGGIPDTAHRPPSAAEMRSRLALDDVMRGGGAAIVPGLEGLIDQPAERDVFEAPATSNAVMRIVVDAPDPFAAQQRIETYLLSNQIVYTATAVDAEMPEPLALSVSQVGVGSRVHQTHPQMRELAKDDQPAVAEEDAAGNVGRDRAAPEQETRAEQKSAPQSHRRYELRGVTRRDVQAMYEQLTPAAGARPQVFEDSINGQMGASTMDTIGVQPMRMPSVIDMRDGTGLRFNLIPAPAADPDDAAAVTLPPLVAARRDDAEKVDVFLYVRSDAGVAADPGADPVDPEPANEDRAESPATPPADEPDDDAPATQPATQPSED